MAWEQRGPGRYFYLCERRGKRVAKQYMGTGILGELAAEAQAQMAQTAREAQQAQAQARQELVLRDRLLDRQIQQCDLLWLAALLAASCYKTASGEWRRRGQSS